MDSQQPGIKRAIQATSFRNQEDEMPSTSEEGGDGTEVKRFKQELHPLQMGAVLEQIFFNLDPDSIKAARQVNRLWSAEGAKMRITKCFVKIPSNIHDGDFVSRLKALEEFKAFLSYKSSGFSTIPNIAVNGAADVDLWKYLGVLGQQVKSLEINNDPDENEEEFFFNLLDLLPNLNYLRFELLGYEPIITRVLTTVMSTLENGRNSLTASFLYVYIDSVEQLVDIEKFASCKNIRIEKLLVNIDPFFLDEFPELVVRVAKVMSTILATSQNILTTLNLEDCHPFFPLLEFPCLTALTHVDLEFEFEIAELSNCKFPLSFRFSEKVPSLSSISIKERMLDDPPVNVQIGQHCFTNLFESAGTAPSVKHVQCWGKVSDFDVYYLFKMFPNIEEFQTDVNWHSHVMLRSLWKHGRNLKKLFLDFDFDLTLYKIDDLDASFTGLPLWTVDVIRKTSNLDPFTLEELDELRVESSILHMKELEQLIIHFRGSWKNGPPKRVLAVAGEHAFKFLPKNPEIIINNKEFKDSMDLVDVSKLSNVKIVS